MPEYQSKRQKPQAPFRICQACGGSFRSWREGRYCSRRRCREERNAGAGGEGDPFRRPEAAVERLRASATKPPAVVPFNEFPPGF